MLRRLFALGHKVVINRVENKPFLTLYAFRGDDFRLANDHQIDMRIVVRIGHAPDVFNMSEIIGI